MSVENEKSSETRHPASSRRSSARDAYAAVLPRSFLLRARFVLPISRPPIADGAVLVSGSRISAVGPFSDFPVEPRKRAIDLGEVLLLPGLVNAHCHLDYTDMAGEFAPPKVFTDWLKLLTTAKGHWKLSDYATSWTNGAAMLLSTGTTTVADIEAMPQLLPQVWESTPLRVFSFLEMIGLTNRRLPQAVLEEAVDKIASMNGAGRDLGLSPHAPYTTVPELLRLNAAMARRRRWRLCTHVAESSLEYEMFRHGRGEMFEWLRRSGRDVSDCGLGSPVQHLERCGLLGKNLLAVHANYLGRRDAILLGKRGVSVVHCPRSHAFFRHAPFPLKRLLRNGVNICLGTDSLVSVVQTRRQPLELSMFEEMKALASREPSLSPKTVLRMATVNGARALGLEKKVGELTPKASADMIAIPFTGKAGGVWNAVLHHHNKVSIGMIGGKWTIPPPE